MSSDSRASKRSRQGVDNASGEDEPPLDLLALYQSDIGGRILSFASGADLCKLDILNKQFSALTTEPWKRITKERFGMNNGKEGWRQGTSFLRPPVFIHLRDYSYLESGVAGYGYGYYPGSPRVAANESIIVAVSDDADGLGEHPNNEMGTRDASNLNYIRSIPSPINNWRVSICGKAGSEIVVTSNYNQICARHGNDLQRWRYNVHMVNGIPSIGCETHLIVATNGRIHIYEVNLDGRREDDIAELLLLRQTITADSGVNELITPTIAWGPDKRHFIICFNNQIYVYKFDKETGNATLVESIDVGDLVVANVALAEDYIVICSHDRKIHVWNRNTGEKIVYRRSLPGGTSEEIDALCDYELDEDEEEELLETACELQFSCHGHIVVSTSHIGCAICIWDMKTGRLLKRHNEANEEGVVESNDVTDMEYLETLNAFLCMDGYMNIWSFPTNKRQYDMTISTRRREEMVRRVMTQED